MNDKSKSGVDMSVVNDRVGALDTGGVIPVGTQCEYLGHLPGGLVKVRLPDGREVRVSPTIFPRLR
jgi:hypothetical protein